MSLFLLNDKFIHILFFLSDLQAQNEEEDKAAEEDKKFKAAVPTTYQTKNRKPQPVEAVCDQACNA